MNAQAEIPVGHPMRDAWERYRLTEDYANTKRWAIHAEHVEGSLWAAFVKGWTGIDEPSSTETISRLTAENERNLTRCYALEGANASLMKRIDKLTAENDRLRKLCPSMVELDTNEALHPESTITVAVGYLHTLLEAKEQLRWRKVSEIEPPKDGREFFGFMQSYNQGKGSVRMLVWMDWSDRPGFYSHLTGIHEPTHWREIGPLPEAGTD